MLSKTTRFKPPASVKTGEGGQAPCTPNSGRLGQREREVLDVVWVHGKATVQDVSQKLSNCLAYTTVMTTLDRLFKKGLLHRVKQNRAFIYSPAASPSEIESLRAQALLENFFAETVSSPDVLLSCLVDVIERFDDELLRSLEAKVREAKSRIDTKLED
jgi:predicted transcriptional regulator